MKISPADQAFSRCVRERADWTCEKCHTSLVAGHHSDTDFDWDPICQTCHIGVSIVADVHKGNCNNCHVFITDGAINLRAGIDGDATLASALGDPKTATCTDCHDTATYPLGSIHHDTVTASNNNCAVCHASVDHTLMVTDSTPTPDCTVCHTATAGTTGGVPLDIADSLVHDACRSCHTFDADKRGILVDFTNQKGVNGTGQLPDNGTIGDIDGGGLCTACHTGALEIMHHSNAHVAIGQCEYCHADPRTAAPLSAPWDATPWTRPGDNLDGDAVIDSVDIAVPTQLACVECHVRFVADGSVMTVVKYADRSDYISYATNWDQSIQHTIPGVTAGQINNYGMCLGCHDGSSATAVKVWHARPDQHDPGYEWNLGTRNYRRGSVRHTNEAMYVAGRSSSGIGRFNLNFSQYGGSYPLARSACRYYYCGSSNKNNNDPYEQPQDISFTRIYVPAVNGSGGPGDSVPVFAAVTP